MSSSSAETVANIEELLKQILVRVPALSLIRFKSVSKHWLSLISDPDFRRRHTLQNPNPKISAFFDESFNSIPVKNSEIPPGWNPFKTLTDSVPDGSKLRILQSCNGLFLCHIPVTYQRRNHDPVYVVNPTTSQFLPLSSPSINRDTYFVRYALAFDPSKSPHYKVLCVTNHSYYFFWNDHRDQGHHRIEMYSSETAEWKRLDLPFFPRDDCRERAMQFDERSREGAVYCNGAVHWIRDRMKVGLCWGRTRIRDGPWSLEDAWLRNDCDLLHYFDVREEQFRLAPATPPPVPLVAKDLALPTDWPRFERVCFGECGGRLYLIESFQHCKTRFEVMEMERDYSGWLVKYCVDLNSLVAALPGEDWDACVVLGLSQEDETDNGVEDTSTNLLLQLPGKIISYNLRDETFKTSVKLGTEELFQALGDYNHIQEDVDYHHTQEDVTFPYMETLTCV